MAATLSLDIWPAHPRPLPDELLSSWLVRLAHANGYKTQSFYAFYLGRHAVLWNRDVDRSLPTTVIEDLGPRAAISPKNLEAMSLRNFNGHVYEDCEVKRNCSWLLALGIKHRLRRQGGLQFCSACLSADAKPYFRRTWRMAWATVCVRHGLVLKDRCPRCGDPVQFHRTDMTQKSHLKGDVKLTVCTKCGFDLAKHEDAQAASVEVIALQAQMERAATEGFISFAGNPNLASLAYFDGMHILAAGLAKLLSAKNGGDSSAIEMMDRETRTAVMEKLASTVEDWPRSFVQLTNSIPGPYTHFLRDRKKSRVPYWLLSEIDQTRRSSPSMPAEERDYICAVTEATMGRLTGAGARELFKRDISRHLSIHPVSHDDAEMFVASIDQAISAARGKYRRDLLRDKVMFVTARILRLTTVQVANLELSILETIPVDGGIEYTGNIPRTPFELGNWLHWYLEEVRPQYRAAHISWLFLSDSICGQASDSLISSRFQTALRRTDVSRRIGNFSRWIKPLT
jgi:hypothetical protein